MPAEWDDLHPVVFLSSTIKMLSMYGDVDEVSTVISRGECLETPNGTCLLVAGLQLCDLISLDESSDASGSVNALQKACASRLGHAQPTLLLFSQEHGLHLQIAPAELIQSPVCWKVTLLLADFQKKGEKIMQQLYGNSMLRLESLPDKPEAKCPVVVISNLPKLLSAPASAAIPTSVTGAMQTEEEGSVEDTVDAGSLHEVSE